MIRLPLFVFSVCFVLSLTEGQVNFATGLGPNDGTDSGLVSGRTLTFIKLSSDTPLHITYTDNMRAYSPNQQGQLCYWRILIDGANCPSGDLRYDRHTYSNGDGDFSNDLYSGTLEGICENVSSGTHTIEIEVEGGGTDCHTGYNQGRWLILAEEIGIEPEDGMPGSDGAKGDPGERGPQGVQGIQGTPGDPGQVGPVGEQGPSGEGGTKGDPGEKGEPGNPGFSGLPGVTGPVGPSGVDGQQGNVGEIGPPGQMGDIGPPGLPGQDGSPGEGAPGIEGPPGPVGQKGDPGEPGPPGPTTNVDELEESIREIEEELDDLKEEVYRMAGNIDLILVLLTGSQ